jgi:hypothetical protein
MLEQTPHQTNAVALEETECLEVDRNDIMILLQKKPHAGMDMLTVLGRQFHAAQQLVRVRANRNPNEIIEEEATFGERIADAVAGFGGSWTFIIIFLAVLLGYSTLSLWMGVKSWDPYPFILLNLFNAGRNSSAGHHDESESPGHEGPTPQRTRFRRQSSRRV